MATSAVYGWRYQGLADPPNGATLGQFAVTDIEATMQLRQAEIIALQASNTAILAAAPYRDRQTVGASVSSVTFSSIPSTLRSVEIRWTARGDAATTHALMGVRVNGDTGVNYNYQFLQANATATAANVGPGTYWRAGSYTCASTTAGIYASGRLLLQGWDSPHSGYLGYTFETETMAAGFIHEIGGGTFTSAGPYTSITLLATSGNFIAGSDFTLIGDRT